MARIDSKQWWLEKTQIELKDEEGIQRTLKCLNSAYYRYKKRGKLPLSEVFINIKANIIQNYQTNSRYLIRGVKIGNKSYPTLKAFYDDIVIFIGEHQDILTKSPLVKRLNKLVDDGIIFYENFTFLIDEDVFETVLDQIITYRSKLPGEIYKLTINYPRFENKAYIGATQMTLEQRLTLHIADAERDDEKPNNKLVGAIRYLLAKGVEVKSLVSMDTLEKNIPYLDLSDAECDWVGKFKNDYPNITLLNTAKPGSVGGRGGTRIVTCTDGIQRYLAEASRFEGQALDLKDKVLYSYEKRLKGYFYQSLNKISKPSVQQKNKAFLRAVKQSFVLFETGSKAYRTDAFRYLYHGYRMTVRQIADARGDNEQMIRSRLIRLNKTLDLTNVEVSELLDEPRNNQPGASSLELLYLLRNNDTWKVLSLAENMTAYQRQHTPYGRHKDYSTLGFLKYVGIEKNKSTFASMLQKSKQKNVPLKDVWIEFDRLYTTYTQQSH